MSQEIKYIPVKNLILWSENPREPLSSSASNQEIVNQALLDSRKKWEIPKLAASMGDIYDMSELPTVVYRNGKPVVYDGNRRVILAMIHLKLVDWGECNIDTPEVPDMLPCNVCDEETALNNVFRKHSTSGSWNMIERDAFIHYNMKRPKSIFLAIDEAVDNFISSNADLNKRFIKEEVLDDKTLQSMGIRVSNGILQSKHSPDELYSILLDILSCVRTKKISTRTNRGKLFDVISGDTRAVIERNKERDYQNVPTKKNPIEKYVPNDSPKPKSRTRRVNEVQLDYFGGKLILKSGEVNNLYRDSDSLVQFYYKNEKTLSAGFSALLRMAFRLICETAARDINNASDPVGWYVDTYFNSAKKLLTQDEKTFLSSQNVKTETIKQLLHTGAHNYSSAKVPEQGKAISIILGKMLILSHGK